MAAAHSYIQMFIHVCRTSQADIRIMSVGHWGSELGLTVLRGLSKLYSSLVWESSVMLALINGSLIPKGKHVYRVMELFFRATVLIDLTKVDNE